MFGSDNPTPPVETYITAGLVTLPPGQTCRFLLRRVPAETTWVKLSCSRTLSFRRFLQWGDSSPCMMPWWEAAVLGLPGFTLCLLSPAAHHSSLLFFASMLALLAPLLALDIENLERLHANLDEIANLHSDKSHPGEGEEIVRLSRASGPQQTEHRSKCPQHPAGNKDRCRQQGFNSAPGMQWVPGLQEQLTSSFKLLHNYVVRALTKPSLDPCWPKDCSEVPAGSSSGIYVIQPTGLHPIVVSCEMNVTDGGWTVIQRNQQSTEITWAESWSTYKYGFGNVHSDYWLGTEYIHRISQQKVYQVRFVIWDATNNIKFADYNLFSVEDESQGYRLRLGTYSGLAGDAMTSNSASTVHDNMKFSAKDLDQDTYSGNCASSYGGGWWYSACYSVRLNVKGAIAWGSLCNGNCKASAVLIKPAPYC
ncbi:uncharacterized protein LOC141952797 [Strix uralensis]|uniref:uncharacterized protein LOC141952797 n=1 Tax=Strix uralensis TaxID=36305 RepID=UPI003DA72CC8